MKRFCICSILTALCMAAGTLPVHAADAPDGWILWHSYSDYAARDSRLFLRKPDGSKQEITGDFAHAMNGSFGRTPDQIVFMAIDRAADEWDIFLYDSGKIVNLTQNSGFRNEDPKWSPDGSQIVMKRGHWDHAADDFVYDLALLDPESGAVTMLTDDRAEQAMPCFSSDGSALYYAEYQDGIGKICRMEMQSHKSETIFSETGVTAYYPVACGDHIYFTKWYSTENRHDQIMQYDGRSVTAMPFDSDAYDCSDACPFSGGMIYSSTQNGSYDLYYFDGVRSIPLNDLNSTQNDLGASYFAVSSGDVNADGACDAADADALRNALLGKPDPVLHHADLNGDGRISAADLTALKRMLLHAE